MTLSIVFFLVFFSVSASTQSQHRYSIGYMGALPTFDIYRSPSLPSSWNFSWTPEEKKVIFDAVSLSFVNETLQINATVFRVNTVEYFISWAQVENEGQNIWNFSQVIDDMNLIKQMTDFEIVPYMYSQALPSWMRNNYTAFERSKCLEHSNSTEFLSTFADTTALLMSRFYNACSTFLQEFIPTKRDIVVRFATPSDFGEVGFPAGFAQSEFPVPHVHAGFWVEEIFALNAFQQYMLTKYTSVSAINQAWDTAFTNPSDITFPNVIGTGPLAVSDRYWGDFINWYHEVMTNNTFLLIKEAASPYYNILNLNFGDLAEPITYGMDISALYKGCAQNSIWSRAPAGNPVPIFNTKRHATAFKFYRPPQFSMEVPDGNQPEAGIALYLFQCLTSGVTWNFEAGDNVLRAPQLYQQYDALISQPFIAINRSLPLQDTAFFFSTISHRLNRTVDINGNFESYPVNVVELATSLREAIDFDVVDELLIADGVLSFAKYNLVMWFGGSTTYNSTLNQLMDWVTNSGGIFAVFDLRSIRVYESGELWWTATNPPVSQAYSFGKGYIFDSGANEDSFLPFCVLGWKIQNAVNNPNLPTAPLPPIPVIDSVYVSFYQQGILVFNNQATPANKTLSIGNETQWRVEYPLMPVGWTNVISLQPFQMVFLDGYATPSTTGSSSSSSSTSSSSSSTLVGSTSTSSTVISTTNKVSTSSNLVSTAGTSLSSSSSTLSSASTTEMKFSSAIHPTICFFLTLVSVAFCL